MVHSNIVTELCFPWMGADEETQQELFLSPPFVADPLLPAPLERL